MALYNTPWGILSGIWVTSSWKTQTSPTLTKEKTYSISLVSRSSSAFCPVKVISGSLFWINFATSPWTCFLSTGSRFRSLWGFRDLPGLNIWNLTLNPSFTLASSTTCRFWNDWAWTFLCIMNSTTFRIHNGCIRYRISNADFRHTEPGPQSKAYRTESKHWVDIASRMYNTRTAEILQIDNKSPNYLRHLHNR